MNKLSEKAIILSVNVFLTIFIAYWTSVWSYNNYIDGVKVEYQLGVINQYLAEISNLRFDANEISLSRCGEETINSKSMINVRGISSSGYMMMYSMANSSESEDYNKVKDAILNINYALNDFVVKINDIEGCNEGEYKEAYSLLSHDVSKYEYIIVSFRDELLVHD